MVEKDSEFLTRWSRLKAESRAQDGQKIQPAQEPPSDEADESAAPHSDEAREQQVGDDAAHDNEAATIDQPDYEDVDFDALDFSSDFTPFMKKGVPEAIQRRALRKLWASDPILANIDGLNDYDEDFTDAALAVKALKTAYKVGSGYLTDNDLKDNETAIGDESREGEDDSGISSSVDEVDEMVSEENKTVSNDEIQDESGSVQPDANLSRKS